MFTVKQLFLILSVLSLASAKKGTSIRASPGEEVELRRGLKKSSKKGGTSGGSFFPPPPNRGGGVVGGGAVGTNRDGTPAGVLIEPAGKSCIPFDEAKVWLTGDYPGDVPCRGGVPASTSSGCCRVFDFHDNGGSQKWLLWDANNQYRDLMCVCNENTRSGGGGAPTDPIIPVDIGNPPVASPVAAPVALPPVASTGGAVCGNPNPTQLDLQSRPGVLACVTNKECGGDEASKCCSVDTCICYPKSFLDPSKCIPAAP